MPSLLPSPDAIAPNGVAVLAVALVLVGVQHSDRAATALNAGIATVTRRVPYADRVAARLANPHLRMVSNVWKYLLLLALAFALAGVDPAWVNLAAVDPATVLVGGVALGAFGYVFGELLGLVLFDGFGFEYDTTQRAAMAPDTRREYVEFLGVGLPVICAWEELLFRGVLVGVAANALAVSPWTTAVLSVLYFGYVHRYMGTGAVVVTTLMGAVLTVAFVLGASLALLVLAHFVTNTLEFLVHESSLGDPLPTERFGFGA